MILKFIKRIFGKNGTSFSDGTIVRNLKENTDNYPPTDFKLKIKSELEPFAKRADEIRQKEDSIMDNLKSNGIRLSQQNISMYLSELSGEKQTYIRDLSNTKAYKEIMPWIENEVYRLFTLQSIESEEKFLAAYPNGESQGKIERAKKLLEENPRSAAEQFLQLGSCHTLWGIKRSILKEQFDVIWYSPAELSPGTIFD